MLTRTLGLTQDASAAKFSDVSPGQWFAGAIGAAVNAGLVSGYEDGTFRPDAPVSREEIAAMTIRAIKTTGFAAGVSDVDAAIAGFNDKDKISGWATIFVASAVEAGFISGRESGDFAPSEHVIRAEATAILARTQSYIKSVTVK